jgi:hypothetical protein
MGSGIKMSSKQHCMSLMIWVLVSNPGKESSRCGSHIPPLSQLLSGRSGADGARTNLASRMAGSIMKIASKDGM